MIELPVVQFWSEIILMISNQTCAVHSFHFEITNMISNQISVHSVQLPLLILIICSRTFTPSFIPSHQWDLVMVGLTAEFSVAQWWSIWAQNHKVWGLIPYRDQRYVNPLTPKIWLLILPFSYNTLPCKLFTRICCYPPDKFENSWYLNNIWIL